MAPNPHNRKTVASVSEKMREIQEEIRTAAERERHIFEAAQYMGEDRVVPANEVVEQLREAEKLNRFNLQSKIPQLDALIGGFREGQLIILSAPTGQGKTTFSKTLTANFDTQDVRSLWFSFEVGQLEFAESFPGAINYVVPRILKESSLEWIQMRIAESLGKYKSKVVFIDHLHYLLDLKQLALAKSTSILIGHLLREMKKTALYYNIVIVLIAHLKNIDVMSEIPTIDDLRDSSFIGQESDIVLLLWRKAVEQSKQEKAAKLPVEWTNETVLSVAKNRRTGRLGFVHMIYRDNEFREQSSLKDDLTEADLAAL